MRKDKIFDNNFSSPEFEAISNFTFDLDPSFRDNRDEEDKIQQEMLNRDIHELITKSRFKHFNEIDEHGQRPKLNKVDINNIYGFVVDELIKEYTRIDMFSELCVYFDIKPARFYNFISNAYKEQLIEELDNKTGILSKKNIKKLF